MLPQSDRVRKGSNYQQKKLNFMKLTEGKHIVRLLQPLDEVKLSHTHWIRNTSIECPGEETCPICQNNRQILVENDNDWTRAKKNKSFNPWQLRYYANVLDLTPVKVSPQSEKGFENKAKPDLSWPVTCGDTGDFLEGIEARPSNTVKILSGGVTLFGDLENIAKSVLSEQTEEPIGLQNYDLVLMVSGKGRERNVTPIPQPHRNSPIDYSELELFDLERALISFSPEEINSFVAGVSLKDIWAARRATEENSEDVAVSSSFVEEESTEKVAEKVDVMTDKVKDLINSNK